MDESTISSISHLLTMAEALKQQNESLQGFVQFLQLQMPKESSITHESPYFQPLLGALWEEGIPKDFKLPPLSIFDSLTDPEHHIWAIND